MESIVSKNLSCRIPLVATVAVLIALSAPTTLALANQPAPVTTAEALQMSRQGVPASTIVAKMRDSNAVYRLTAGELARLHDEGVTDEVIDYMQETYLNAVRRKQTRIDWNYWTLEADGDWSTDLLYCWLDCQDGVFGEPFPGLYPGAHDVPSLLEILPR
jgi:hypothetical protein